MTQDRRPTLMAVHAHPDDEGQRQPGESSRATPSRAAVGSGAAKAALNALTAVEGFDLLGVLRRDQLALQLQSSA